MNSAYKKECWVALIAFVAFTVLTHIFPLWFIFPSITEGTIFGFPTHYFVMIVVGWLLLIPLYWIYIEVSEKIDDEIAESSPFAVLEEQERERAAAAEARSGGAE
jgi:glycerol-3-phosphate acyltransferase PlsY